MAKTKAKIKSAEPEIKSRPFACKRWLTVILILHVALGLVYWMNTPFGGSPDEVPHSRYVEHLVTSKALPVYDVSQAEGYEFYQPPLYYLLGVPFYLLGRVVGLENPAQMVRLLSLLLGGLSVLMIYLAAEQATRDRKLAVICAAFVALLPTHTMMSSSVSNDILMELVFGAGLFLMADLLVNGLSRARILTLGIVLGAGILSKMTCLALFPVAVVAFMLLWKRRGLSAGQAMGQLAAVVILALVIGGWWFMRNTAVYHDLLGLGVMQEAFLSHSPRAELLIDMWSPLGYLMQVAWWTFRSFWGVFGHMDKFMPVWIYWAAALVSLTALVGSRRGLKRISESDPALQSVMLVYGVTLLLVVLAFLKLNTTVFQAQGRYLYPALVPISLLWTAGLSGVLPGKARTALPYLAVGLPILAQLVALGACVL